MVQNCLVAARDIISSWIFKKMNKLIKQSVLLLHHSYAVKPAQTQWVLGSTFVIGFPIVSGLVLQGDAVGLNFNTA